MTKLDLYDKKILYELDKNSTISLSELSKKIRRSKQFVLFRLKQLEREIITGYQAIIDMSKLGYFTFRIYFKFQQITNEDGKIFIEYVKKNLPEVWTITSIHGKWDYALFLGVKKISEFHKIWDIIILNYKKYIKSYIISIYAPIYNFNRKFFVDEKYDIVQRVYGDGEKIDIDDTDERLIKIYASNVRKSYLDMAKELKISSDTVRRRIKDLEKKKVIIGYKLGLNLESLGLASYRIDIQLVSTNRNKELFEYCKQNKYIYQINKTIGGADFEIEVVVKDFNHLKELLNEIRIRFKDVINDIDYFVFSTFHILNYIPD